MGNEVYNCTWPKKPQNGISTLQKCTTYGAIQFTLYQRHKACYYIALLLHNQQPYISKCTTHRHCSLPLLLSQVSWPLSPSLSRDIVQSWHLALFGMGLSPCYVHTHTPRWNRVDNKEQEKEIYFSSAEQTNDQIMKPSNS